ncbi:hypothetical protein PR048_010983 [Dryococelus australis]|uniref:Uncharacterized protein n=1 Tax=Dryococelus australis TaxID=614101 RepID=A0ABQ9HKD1_9NEOP|nr:hypothetical protein PR048_010983 [Dryococelus australis]
MEHARSLAAGSMAIAMSQFSLHVNFMASLALLRSARPLPVSHTTDTLCLYIIDGGRIHQSLQVSPQPEIQGIKISENVGGVRNLPTAHSDADNQPDNAVEWPSQWSIVRYEQCPGGPTRQRACPFTTKREVKCFTWLPLGAPVVRGCTALLSLLLRALKLTQAFLTNGLSVKEEINRSHPCSEKIHGRIWRSFVSSTQISTRRCQPKANHFPYDCLADFATSYVWTELVDALHQGEKQQRRLAMLPVLTVSGFILKLFVKDSLDVASLPTTIDVIRNLLAIVVAAITLAELATVWDEFDYRVYVSRELSEDAILIICNHRKQCCIGGDRRRVLRESRRGYRVGSSLGLHATANDQKMMAVDGDTVAYKCLAQGIRIGSIFGLHATANDQKMMAVDGDTVAYKCLAKSWLKPWSPCHNERPENDNQERYRRRVLRESKEGIRIGSILGLHATANDQKMMAVDGDTVAYKCLAQGIRIGSILGLHSTANDQKMMAVDGDTVAYKCLAQNWLNLGLHATANDQKMMAVDGDTVAYKCRERYRRRVLRESRRGYRVGSSLGLHATANDQKMMAVDGDTVAYKCLAQVGRREERIAGKKRVRRIVLRESRRGYRVGSSLGLRATTNDQKMMAVDGDTVAYKCLAQVGRVRRRVLRESRRGYRVGSILGLHATANDQKMMAVEATPLLISVCPELAQPWSPCHNERPENDGSNGDTVAYKCLAQVGRGIGGEVGSILGLHATANDQKMMAVDGDTVAYKCLAQVGRGIGGDRERDRRRVLRESTRGYRVGSSLGLLPQTNDQKMMAVDGDTVAYKCLAQNWLNPWSPCHCERPENDGSRRHDTVAYKCLAQNWFNLGLHATANDQKMMAVDGDTVAYKCLAQNWLILGLHATANDQKMMAVDGDTVAYKCLAQVGRGIGGEIGSILGLHATANDQKMMAVDGDTVAYKCLAQVGRGIGGEY